MQDAERTFQNAPSGGLVEASEDKTSFLRKAKQKVADSYLTTRLLPEVDGMMSPPVPHLPIVTVDSIMRKAGSIAQRTTTRASS
jgi:hypothetical protein